MHLILGSNAAVSSRFSEFMLVSMMNKHTLFFVYHAYKKLNAALNKTTKEVARYLPIYMNEKRLRTNTEGKFLNPE